MNGSGRPPVVVVGQIARDLVLVVDEVPGPSGSTDVRQRRELLGGKGANIAVGLSQLGVPVAVVGVVGDDQVGENLLAQCTRDGIDTSAVTRRPDTESALMVDVVTPDGQWRYLESVPGPALLTPADHRHAGEMLGKASTVILQLQQPAAAILAALDRVPPDCRVIMDGVPEDESTRDRILAAATVLRLDAQEAELLAGQEIPDEAAARAVAADLLSRGPELVVIAVGTDGNLVAWPGDATLLPLVDAAEVVDTTGSGDAFVAGLTWALDRGEDRVRAGQLATAAAGLTVGHPGGRPTLTARGHELADALAQAARERAAATINTAATRTRPTSVSGRTREQRRRAFPVEPWQLREVGLDPDHLARTESLFALSNGHIGVRGNLDEGEPNDLPGTYLNSFFESHRLTYPESGYGYPESGQSIVNVPNGKIIRLLVDDEPFDVRYGRLLAHERILDFRSGTLRREVEWETPAGQRVRIRSTRLVSLDQRAVLAIRYEVEPVEHVRPGRGPVRAAGQRAACPIPTATPAPTTPSPPTLVADGRASRAPAPA